ncbi:hypothetical protein L1887_54454 [Cichorium endivia]|nr:hypothetical protein L1887_54454 [Cichorium endivia]
MHRWRAEATYSSQIAICRRLPSSFLLWLATALDNVPMSRLALGLTTKVPSLPDHNDWLKRELELELELLSASGIRFNCRPISAAQLRLRISAASNVDLRPFRAANGSTRRFEESRALTKSQICLSATHPRSERRTALLRRARRSSGSVPAGPCNGVVHP